MPDHQHAHRCMQGRLGKIGAAALPCAAVKGVSGEETTSHRPCRYKEDAKAKPEQSHTWCLRSASTTGSMHHMLVPIPSSSMCKKKSLICKLVLVKKIRNVRHLPSSLALAIAVPDKWLRKLPVSKTTELLAVLFAASQPGRTWAPF